MMTTSVTTERQNGTRRVAKEFPNQTLTEQQHKDRVNINRIMQRARKGAGVPIYDKQATYGDFSNVLEYQECMNRLVQAENDFQKLPAEVRKKFDNDPAKLIDFMQNMGDDPAMIEEAIEIGLVERQPEPVIPKVEVVNQPKEKASQTAEEAP